MIAAYRNSDRAAGLRTVSALIDALSNAVPVELTELITLGRTLNAEPPTSLPTPPGPAPATARPRPSTAGSSTYAAAPWGSAT